MKHKKNKTLPNRYNDLSQPPMAQVKAWDLPQYRQQVAIENGCERKVAFITYGGLGDVLCAEPTIRYACEVLKETLKLESITVITRFPEIFSHLPVEILLTSPEGTIDIPGGQSAYHFLYCGHPEGNLQNSYFTHNSMLPVDYPALSSLRMQLPLHYRVIQFPTPYSTKVPDMDYSKFVAIHAGAHWQSKRFPKEWWDEVINQLGDRAIGVVLIGGPPTEDQDNPGTVDINPSGCLDLRGMLSVADSASLLKKVGVLLTNDSFPLHLATIGKAHIGFLATAKDPEWLMHYRYDSDNSKIEFGWRMENLAKGGAYQRSYTESLVANALSKATPEEMASWLPEPIEVARWVQRKLDGKV